MKKVKMHCLFSVLVFRGCKGRLHADKARSGLYYVGFRQYNYPYLELGVSFLKRIQFIATINQYLPFGAS